MSIRQFRRIEAVLAPGRHPFEIEHRSAIDEGWARRSAQNPHLYDGETVLAERWRADGDELSIACKPIRYASLLHWLATPGNQPPPEATEGPGIHFFASAAMITSDNRLLVARMAGHTFNAGKVYMPSGSLELADFAGESADLDGNMRREVAEETGIDLGLAQCSPLFEVYLGGGIMAIFRRYRFAASAAELLARIGAVATDNELAEVMSIGLGETVDAMPVHVRAYCAWLKAAQARI